MAETIKDISLGELHPFPDHPFDVRDDDTMKQTIESIREYGVLVPAIARPREDGGYELIAGHRRKYACEIAGLDTMPVIVRDIDRNVATIIMVDSNLQRENILPSEKAKAYKMKLDAIKRQAGRPSRNSVQVGQNLDGKTSREQIAENSPDIDAARAVYQKAKEELEAVKAIPVAVVKTIKNEILDVIRKVAERNNNRLSLPIMKGKFIGAVSDRASLQDRAKMEAYVQGKGWTTFAEMQAERKSVEAQYDQLDKSRADMCSRMDYLEKLLDMHRKYEPYQKINAEYWKLKKAEETKGKGGILGFAKKSLAEEYKKKHQTELTTYRMYRDVLKDMIAEPDKKIVPKSWQKELDGLEERYAKTQRPYSDAVVDLAKMEVLNHNKRDLERMLENESHQRNRGINKIREERT